MRLTWFLVLIFTLPISASVWSQNTSMRVNLKNSTLQELLLHIENNSSYRFFYNNDEVDVNKSISVEMEGKSIGSILSAALEGLPYTFKEVENKLIIIEKKGTLSNSLDINLQQQQKSVSGKVTDSSGGSLPGVSVVLKGTTIGTITDGNGNYSISNVPANATLQFSFVGMKMQEIVVGNKTSINATLEDEPIGLEEVVAIGYGTTTKRTMVGSISSVDTEKLEQTSFNNVGQTLQGQVPGVIVENSGGAPGSKPTISIRGGGTPLYVIDGVITTEQDFNALNSDDVKTISFLKDASATAVYGSRAGDGIVLVTTKIGKEGKININYSYDYQLSQPTFLPKMMSSYQFALEQNAANKYENAPLTYTDQQLETVRTHANLDTYPDNNWPGMTLKNFAPEQRHNLSLTGGDKKTNYFVSLGYVDQGSILKTDVVNYKRLNIRSNMTTKFENIGLEVSVNVNASLENYKEPSAGMTSVWKAINQNTTPSYRAYNLDGTLAGGGDGDNPLALISKDAGYKKTRDAFINAQIDAKWQVPNVKGFKLGMMANYRDGNGWDKKWNNNAPLYMQDGSIAIQPLPALILSSYYNTRLYFESSASYAHNFGKHGIDATVVYNQTTSFNANMNASRRDYLSSGVSQLFAGSALGKDNNGNESEAANAGYVMRVKYNYDFKYILEVSGRYDGNDNFAPFKRWGFFPAVSAAWNVSGENFMKSLSDRNIINNLKLRASYGVTGSTEGVNRFGYIPVYNLVPSVYNIGNTLVNGYAEGNLVNPGELTWYTRSSLNYGLDFSSFNNKLSGTLEYFYYRTTGFLMSPNNVYSEPLGKALPQIKSNSAQRRAGFELSLRYKGKLNKLQYEIGGNYSYYNQLWEKLDTQNPATLQNPYTRITHRTAYWQGGAVYLTNGLYQNGNEILNSPRLLASTQTQDGDIRYKDVNGDGKIDAQDKRIVGLPSSPHGIYGIDFNLKYKGWFMNGLFQGTGNRYVAFEHFMIDNVKRLTYTYQLNYWTPDNPNALYPRVISSVSLNGGNNDTQTNPSDFYLKNARYFRLKNLQFGYDFKKSLLANVQWIASCKMFLNATNLFTLSPVIKYFDPEQVEQGTSGTVGYGYPVQRTYSFGVSVGF